jgi:hypothetical protein
MGYNTSYSLSWTKQPNYVEQPNCDHDIELPAKFCPECGKPGGFVELNKIVADHIKGSEEMSYALCPDGSTSENSKWYDWERDMRAMSSEIENVLFKLHGEGEESSDIWDAYFLNGKSQRHEAVITIAPFDPDKWDKT